MNKYDNYIATKQEEKDFRNPALRKKQKLRGIAADFAADRAAKDAGNDSEEPGVRQSDGKPEVQNNERVGKGKRARPKRKPAPRAKSSGAAKKAG